MEKIFEVYVNGDIEHMAICDFIKDASTNLALSKNQLPPY